MFLRPKDLVLPEGQVVSLAGGFGVAPYRAAWGRPIAMRQWQRNPVKPIATRRGLKRFMQRYRPGSFMAKRSMSGLGQVANPNAAEALVLAQKIMAAKKRAETATKIADQVVRRAEKKAKMAGMGWYNPFSAASEWLADNVVTPVAEIVGDETYAYIPKEEEIAAAEANVQRLEENIQRREEARAEAVASGDAQKIAQNPPVPTSTRQTAKVGREAVAEMQEAREKMLNPFGEVGRIWKKARWYVAGGAALIVGAAAYGLYTHTKG